MEKGLPQDQKAKDHLIGHRLLLWLNAEAKKREASALEATTVEAGPDELPIWQKEAANH